MGGGHVKTTFLFYFFLSTSFLKSSDEQKRRNFSAVAVTFSLAFEIDNNLRPAACQLVGTSFVSMYFFLIFNLSLSFPRNLDTHNQTRRSPNPPPRMNLDGLLGGVRGLLGR